MNSYTLRNLWYIVERSAFPLGLGVTVTSVAFAIALGFVGGIFFNQLEIADAGAQLGFAGAVLGTSGAIWGAFAVISYSDYHKKSSARRILEDILFKIRTRIHVLKLVEKGDTLGVSYEELRSIIATSLRIIVQGIRFIQEEKLVLQTCDTNILPFYFLFTEEFRYLLPDFEKLVNITKNTHENPNRQGKFKLSSDALLQADRSVNLFINAIYRVKPKSRINIRERHEKIFR